MQSASTVADRAVKAALSKWLAGYETGRDFAGDDDFARWLKEDYAPLAGGWHY